MAQAPHCCRHPEQRPDPPVSRVAKQRQADPATGIGQDAVPPPADPACCGPSGHRTALAEGCALVECPVLAERSVPTERPGLAERRGLAEGPARAEGA